MRRFVYNGVGYEEVSFFRGVSYVAAPTIPPGVTEAQVAEARKIATERMVQSGVLGKETAIRVEEDGIDVTYDVKASAWGLPAELVYDLSLKGLFGRSRTKLNEIHFVLCNKAYIANDKGEFTELEKAVAFLQRYAQAKPKFATNAPDETDTVVTWLGDQVMILLQSGVNLDLTTQQDFIDDIANRILEGADSRLFGNISQAAQQLLPEAWDEMVQRVKERNASIPTRKMALEAVWPFVKGEFAGGEEQIHVVNIDYQHDTFGVAIDAPIPIMFEFERMPGGKAKFHTVAILLCDHSFEVKEESKARNMVKAMLALSVAMFTAANPELNKPFSGETGGGGWSEQKIKQALKTQFVVIDKPGGKVHVKIGRPGGGGRFYNKVMPKSALNAVWANPGKGKGLKRMIATYGPSGGPIQVGLYLKEDGELWRIDLETGEQKEKLGTYDIAKAEKDAEE